MQQNSECRYFCKIVIMTPYFMDRFSSERFLTAGEGRTRCRRRHPRCPVGNNDNRTTAVVAVVAVAVEGADEGAEVAGGEAAVVDIRVAAVDIREAGVEVMVVAAVVTAVVVAVVAVVGFRALVGEAAAVVEEVGDTAEVVEAEDIKPSKTIVISRN